jgi:hypothetical protein
VPLSSLNDWLFGFGDWSADGKGLLVPSFTRAGTPVILEVNRAGKASIVLEGTASLAFDLKSTGCRRNIKTLRRSHCCNWPRILRDCLGSRIILLPM